MKRVAVVLVGLGCVALPHSAHAAEPDLRTAFNNALRYNLALYGGVAPLGSAAETPIRSPATVAYATAVALTTGAYDESEADMPAADASSIASSLALGVAAQYGSTWGGHNWQSAWWSYLAADAALRLGVVDASVRRMVASEADWQLSQPVRYLRDRRGRLLSPGDSGAEEDAWNAPVLELAATLLPSSPHVHAWRTRAAHDRVAALARPADLASVAWLGGSNVSNAGLVVNHYRVSPHYAAVAFGLSSSTRPRNGALVYRSLAAFYRPDGTVGGPVDDWGTAIVSPYVVADAAAARFHYAGAQTQLHAHLSRLLQLQARFVDGHTYADASENKYPGREQVVAGDLATAWLSTQGA